ncbi:MAG: PepSY-associated TM helix domain-containing protein [Polyangia bacterium]|jgi:hypothetical protein|nr:PepSY-associated TM helix domain-containing protein [Polyangia bacterium]
MSDRTRSFWRLIRTLHIYLTMFASIVMFLFALTGFMLNHKDWFGLQSRGRPAPVRAVSGERAASKGPGKQTAEMPMPEGAERGERAKQGERGAAASRGMSPRPTGEGVGGVQARPQPQKGFLAKLTNLHKGKPVRTPVVLMIDVVAFLLMLASITGVMLVCSMPRRRKWGLVTMAVGTAAGLLIFLSAIP